MCVVFVCCFFFQAEDGRREAQESRGLEDVYKRQTFCTAIRVSGQKMRLRPVEQVVEEIERRKIKRFFLTDDNFGLNFRLYPEYMEELFKALRKLLSLIHI